MEQNTADIVIIGGGIIGLATAHRLAREGLRVTVLDRNRIGQEASWAGAGVLKCGSWHRLDTTVQLQRESLRRYPTFVADLRERTGIDPQYVECGRMEVLLDDQRHRMAASEVTAAEAFREREGRSVLELLSRQEARRREPELTPELLGAKLCPLTAQVMNPLLIEALRIACIQERVVIREDCEARGLVRERDRVSAVLTAGGDVTCGQVIVSAGAWSSLIDESFRESMPVYPVRGQIVLLEMVPRPFTHVLEKGKCYLVPRLNGRIIIGATEEHEAGFEKRNMADSVRDLIAQATRLVPKLKQATLVRTWAGLRPGTPDRRPHLGRVPGFSNLWAATGHFRSGLILAPLTAQIMVDLVCRGQTAWDLTRFAPGRTFTSTDASETEAIDDTGN